MLKQLILNYSNIEYLLYQLTIIHINLQITKLSNL
jgi:hypothetical protein